MFNLGKGTLSGNGWERPIAHWEVWFQTPKGLCETLDEAVEVCKSLDMEPDAIIRPVPVAITAHGNYEIIARY